MADDSCRVNMAAGLRPRRCRAVFCCPHRRKGKVMGFLIVFLGGGLGAALRHGINLLSMRVLGAAFPYATAFENVTGSLAMGLIAGYFAFRAGGISTHWQ